MYNLGTFKPITHARKVTIDYDQSCYEGPRYVNRPVEDDLCEFYDNDLFPGDDAKVAEMERKTKQARFDAMRRQQGSKFNDTEQLQHLDLNLGKYPGQFGLGVVTAPARVPRTPAGAPARPLKKSGINKALNKVTGSFKAKDKIRDEIPTGENFTLSNGETSKSGFASSLVTSGAKSESAVRI